MIRRLSNSGVLLWVGAGAAVVIVVFAVVAYLGAQRTTPNTGSDAGSVALGSPSVSASASPAPSASATPTAAPTAAAIASASPAPVHLSQSTAAQHGVLVDKNAAAGTPTWESPAFHAPNTWTISYTWNCGGFGGHFTVAVISDAYMDSPVQKRGDTGSGTATVHTGGSFTIATDTTMDCAWHVTARG